MANDDVVCEVKTQGIRGKGLLYIFSDVLDIAGSLDIST